MAISYSNIGLAEPSTITNLVGAVTIQRGSTNEQQEILVLGDPETSNAMARVVATAPDSTHFGVVVRQVGHSTTVQVSSVAGIVQTQIVGPLSSAAPASNDSGLIVRQVGYSTTVNVSSVAGIVKNFLTDSAGLVAMVTNDLPNSSFPGLNVRLVSGPSTAGDCQIAVSSIAGIVAVNLNSPLSSGNHTDTATALLVRPIGGPISSAAPATGDSGVVVRQVGYSTVVTINHGKGSTTASSATSGSSGTFVSFSSATSTIYVSAFGLSAEGSTSPFTVTVLSSALGTELARYRFRASTAASVGANLAVAQPGYLFRSTSQICVRADIGVTIHAWFSAWRE